jgi:putative transposase
VSQGAGVDDRDVETSGRLAQVLDSSVIDALLAEAQATGTPIDGVDGLLNRMNKAVVERVLAAEVTVELGDERGDPVGVGSGNSRNGFFVKTIATTNGPVTINAPRDRDGVFESRVVPKRVRRLGRTDEMILSLYARGMTTRDIEARLRGVYGVSASRELISNVTDVVADEIELWRNRPVDEVYPIVMLMVSAFRSGIRVR